MHLVDKLLDNARADTELLIKNDEKGDKFSRLRDVDFTLRAPDREKAELIRDFIDDNRYGEAKVLPQDPKDPGLHLVRVTVNMPITQHVLCSISGLMQCVAELFDAEYDGWGCAIQTV